LTGDVAAAGKLGAGDGTKAHGALDIGPRSAVVRTAVEPVAISSSSKSVKVPGGLGSEAEGNLVNISQGGSQHYKARAEVGGIIDARICAHVDCSCGFWVGDNIVDRAGTGESPACGKGRSVVRGDIEGRRIAGVEIVVVLLIAGNESSSRCT
jgi:hypothetical protein